MSALQWPWAREMMCGIKDNIIGIDVKGLTMFGCFELTKEGLPITSELTVGTLFGNI